jgi:hypothetical protein
MRKLVRQLSAIFLIAALADTICLLVFDGSNRLRLTLIHRQTGALSFMMVGASYICLLLSDEQLWRERIKGLLLGTGFFLWGCEQFMQPGPLVTAMDSMVVLIFVTDLGWFILQSLKKRKR